MQGTVVQFLQGVSDPISRNALTPILGEVADSLSSQALSSAGLVINAATSPLVKTGAAATIAIAQGVLRSVAAGTALPALAGPIIAQNSFNIALFYVDRNGTLYTYMGNAATTLAGVGWPPANLGKALLGFVIINPTAGTFTPGTTALDAAGVNTTYVNTIGGMDATILTGL